MHKENDFWFPYVTQRSHEDKFTSRLVSIQENFVQK